MERIDPQHVSRQLWIEHCHRYRWAADLARGEVVDAGCGAGYGSRVLADAPRVERCVGVDVCAETVAQAQRTYGGGKLTFRQGDLTQLPLPDQGTDTVVCLETLEHLEQPQRAIAEAARVLRPGGLLIGSVPSAEFEQRCEAAYGPNPYHKTRFTHADIAARLGEHFAHTAFMHATMEVASVVRPADDPCPATLAVEPEAAWLPALGSLLFVASTAPLDAAVTAGVERARLMPALALVEHDAEQLAPRQQTIRDQATLIDERDAYIRRLEADVNARNERVAERDRRIAEQDGLLRRQQETLEHRDARIRDFESAVASQARMIDERDALIRTTEALVGDRDRTIAALRTELDALRDAQNSTRYCLRMALRAARRRLAGQRRTTA
ncbi:MAG: methyltransferase domain-containing protein [Phycisphaerae bacterium]|jgi:2-polyprenyl-3-methyl-5-hydroxy-6-metoxy-1,4-benzoquinol methylase/uncharacterized coiled-coil protein SlyX